MLAVFLLGTCTGSRFAKRGIAKVEVQTAETRADNATRAAVTVTEHAADTRVADQFFADADAAVTAFYAERSALPPLPISGVTRAPIAVPGVCPVVLFDDDELRLFNLGNKGVEVFRPRGP